jgi:hypothetical protein
MLFLISYRVLLLRAAASCPQRLLRIRQINRAGATKIDPKSFRIVPKSPRIAPKSPAINPTSHRIKDPKPSHARCLPCRSQMPSPSEMGRPSGFSGDQSVAVRRRPFRCREPLEAR